MILEACIETFQQAQKAQQLGAHRLEVCASLDQDGLTPSIELVTQIIQNVDIPIKVMLRPREGGFCYSALELDIMSRSIEAFMLKEVHHFVTGILLPDQTIDLRNMQILGSRFPEAAFTFHKAIDTTANILDEVNKLKEVRNIKAILSSGGQITALTGANMLRLMIEVAAGEIQIIAAGGITHDNLNHLHTIIGAKEYHGRKIVGEL